MPSRQPLDKRLPREIDIKGIAVALAFLLIVTVFAAGRDNRSTSENRQSSSVSREIAPILTTKKTEELQPPDDSSASSIHPEGSMHSVESHVGAHRLATP